jgi:Cellulose binding domain/Glycosyl hydrolase family 12
MHGPHARAGVLAVTAGLLLATANVVVLAVTQQPAAAATQNMTMSYTFPSTTPTGSIAGIDVSALQGGFVNVGIPWNGQIANNTGVNRLMANYWNPASTFAAKPNGTQTVALDDQTGAYHLSNYNASTYFPTGRPGAPCNGAVVSDPCHWTTVNPHFPSDYPAIYKGCHFTQCSAGVGAPFPMTLNSLVSLDSVWHTTVPNAGVGTFDVAYDIWLDRGVQATMPAGAATIGQNDGAEVMLWVGNHGYAPNGTSLTNPITPAGTKLPVTYADSAGGLWDVWIGRQDPTGPHPWNIVTYVKQIPTSNFQLDTKQFLDDALTYNTAARPGLAATLNATCPAQNDGTLLGECVSPSWWLTSVQTGFEIWDLPADGGASQGGALGTTQFSVKPMSVLANDPNGVTGRARAGNSPIIHWQDTFALKYASCAGGTATYSITPGTGTPPINGTLTETPAGSGVYVATVAPLIPGHDGSTISVNVTCPGGVTDSATKPVFIDPSGHIQTTNGLPIQNATVTILRSTSGTAAGPYAPAPAADIQPTTNPETTDATGAFRWDVLAGFYEVQATATGCNTVTTAPLPVPPPQVDLLLRLSCTAAATGVVLPGTGGVSGTGLPVTVAVRPPGITPTGYCADITVTNNTTAPVDWNVSFPVPGGYHINQSWNMVYTQVGLQATNVHANPANPWNKTLQPGQSTTSTGFCANP